MRDGNCKIRQITSPSNNHADSDSEETESIINLVARIEISPFLTAVALN